MNSVVSFEFHFTLIYGGFKALDFEICSCNPFCHPLYILYVYIQVDYVREGDGSILYKELLGLHGCFGQASLFITRVFYFFFFSL